MSFEILTSLPVNFNTTDNKKIFEKIVGPQIPIGQTGPIGMLKKYKIILCADEKSFCLIDETNNTIYKIVLNDADEFKLFEFFDIFLEEFNNDFNSKLRTYLIIYFGETVCYEIHKQMISMFNIILHAKVNFENEFNIEFTAFSTLITSNVDRIKILNYFLLLIFNYMRKKNINTTILNSMFSSDDYYLFRITKEKIILEKDFIPEAISSASPNLHDDNIKEFIAIQTNPKKYVSDIINMKNIQITDDNHDKKYFIYLLDIVKGNYVNADADPSGSDNSIFTNYSKIEEDYSNKIDAYIEPIIINPANAAKYDKYIYDLKKNRDAIFSNLNFSVIQPTTLNFINNVGTEATNSITLPDLKISQNVLDELKILGNNEYFKNNFDAICKNKFKY
jgi:hypothetical protein